ncbi:MAG: tRNA(Ile)-lysidine synthase [Blastocatellia bacterium]|jgi:tRNA(Ile)-lysidine synthase|nr:tRNA(Ile)-lysidine synthase [Blastocatellia bacterium]
MKKPPRKGTADRKPKRIAARARLSRFAQSLLREWKRLDLTTNAPVVVAVSGGADSVALLLALNELVKSGRFKLEMVVAHLDHRLRGEASDADARWVEGLATELGYDVRVGRVDVKRRAAKTGDNLEQSGRRARYEFLEKTALAYGAKLVLTAHTMDDQAETVLLNLLRGSGAGGLGGVDPVRPLSAESEVLLARPLLSWALRQDTESYCRELEVEFRTDEMNLNEKFARVRVRRQLLPLMQSFNPKLVAGLTRTAELLREDHSALDRGAARLLELSLVPGSDVSTLRFDLLASSPPSLRRRVLRLWIEQCRGDLKRLERVHIAALERLVLGDRGGRVIELPGGAQVSRKRGVLEYSGSGSSDKYEPKRMAGRNNSGAGQGGGG